MLLVVRVTVVVVAGWLGGLALARASAAARHVLWLLVLGAAVALPVLERVLPDLPVLPAVAERAAPTAPSAPSPTSDRLGAAAGGARTGASAGPAEGVPRPFAEARSLEDRPTDPGRSLLALWLAGALVLLVRQAVAHARAAALVRSARRPDDPDLDRARTAAARALGLSKPVEVRVSDHVSVPLVVGLVHPRIVLPASSRAWDAERRASVLLHESAHVARRDVLARLTALAACAIYWFHPGVWWAAGRLGSESERSCDDRVVLAGIEPHRYACHLLELAREARGRPPLAALAMARTTELEGRLLRLLSDRTVRTRARGAATTAGAGVALTAAALVAALAPAADERLTAAGPAARSADGTVLEGPRTFDVPLAADERLQVVVRGRVALGADGPYVRPLDEASALALTHLDARGNVRDLYLVQPDPAGEAPRTAWAWPRASPDWDGSPEARLAWEASVLPMLRRAATRLPEREAGGLEGWTEASASEEGSTTFVWEMSVSSSGDEPDAWIDQMPSGWPEARAFVERAGSLVAAVLPEASTGVLREIGAEVWSHLDLRVVWPVAAEAREGHPPMRISGHAHLVLLYGDADRPVVHASTVAGPLEAVLPSVVYRVLTARGEAEGARRARASAAELARAGAELASYLERTIITNGGVGG